MSDANKTYRIRTATGSTSEPYVTINANLTQDYDTFEVLSLSINSVDSYRLHNANYGAVVGRVIANNGFGIPNAKISIFISHDNDDDPEMSQIYPFATPLSKTSEGVRYNLLPDEKVANCHQIVGTFPNKRYMLDNDVILEVYDKYYTYTTRTNNAGDYLIMGVPVGNHTIHMDLDLSDCGILSQKPRDFVYKGYNIEQFENPNMFKTGTTYSTLSQVFTQDRTVNVIPLWGNDSLGETIGLTRADIDVSFKFEPTCVFMGSVAGDPSSQGISKKCIPTEHMGDMDELVTGEGTIEMIRKTPSDAVEEFQIKGTQLINANGVWCYQIPMNLDYMMTDEYGNMVPTDNPDKGIPTRARVRFRVSMQESSEVQDNYFRAKVLVPHNPQNLKNGLHEDYDYEFGTKTREDSFRDLFWNNVYSVKSYIPRFQKRQIGGWKEDRFSGIKHTNIFGANNPMPYNNLRIHLPFMFTVMCMLIKVFIKMLSFVNWLISAFANLLADLGDQNWAFLPSSVRRKLYRKALASRLNTIEQGLCPDLENWYFAPIYQNNIWNTDHKPPTGMERFDLLKQTLSSLTAEDAIDTKSIETQNDDGDTSACLTIKTDYLISCIEMNLAQEYKVINFDFYNDWINGMLYFPRWMRYTKIKKTYRGKTIAKVKVKGCMDDTKIFSKTRRYTQQCSMGYRETAINGTKIYSEVAASLNDKSKNRYHKQRGLTQKTIFGRNGGICHEHSTMANQYVYYLKPCEWHSDSNIRGKKVNLYATDLILLGSLNDCDLNGIPQAFRHLKGTSYIMPTNLALTNMDTNGPLYANDKGTICSGPNGSTAGGTNMDNYRDIAVRELSISRGGLSTELNYYEGSGDDNYKTGYDVGEHSDTIALTEAAGVSWNWTGPGQGGSNGAMLYQPGGHFLGLSCANSETNIKSCINLKRICELGASMSQRKEDVMKINDDGKAEYIYTAPTGFISGDNIIDSEFRTMFATMNSRRLIADKRNAESGYRQYGFTFAKPINFDGSFKNVVNSSSAYNARISVEDENLTKYNIAKGGSRADYDAMETLRTRTRTIESASLDYYKFRFGIGDEELKDAEFHKRCFLYFQNSEAFMPQYENSYYFYFGMKEGATAIDEFNKEFFANCDAQLLETDRQFIDAYIEDIDYCEGIATVKLVCNSIPHPLTKIQYMREGYGWSTAEFNANDNVIEIGGLKFGDYTFLVTDANKSEWSKKLSIGTDIITYDYFVQDFNVMKPILLNRPMVIEPFDADDDDIKDGGFISVSNIKVNLDNANIKIFLRISDSLGLYSDAIPYEEGKSVEIFLDDSRVEYMLHISYKCADDGKEIEAATLCFTPKDTSLSSLSIGNSSYSKAMSAVTKEVLNTLDERDGLTDEEIALRWLVKEATFDNVNESVYTSETFAAKVFARRGYKIVWGYPQNLAEGWTKNYGLLNSENIAGLPNGYVVDDEYICRPTSGDTGGLCKSFYVQSVYENMPYGNYETEPSETLPSIFKPMPFRNGGILLENASNELQLLGPNERGDGNGVYFYAYELPIFKRPFFGEVTLITSRDEAVPSASKYGGNYDISYESYDVDGKGRIIINNGVTNPREYDFSAFSDYKAEDDEFYKASLAMAKRSGNDFNGLNDYNSRNVKLMSRPTLSKIVKNYNSSLSLTEWYPSEDAKSLAKTINMNETSQFYDGFYYSVSENNDDSVAKMKITPFGNSQNVKYYLCHQTSGTPEDHKLLRLVGNKNWSRGGNGGYVAPFLFTADYKDFEISSGETVALYLENDKIYYKTYPPISFNVNITSGAVSDNINKICEQWDIVKPIPQMEKIPTYNELIGTSDGIEEFLASLKTPYEIVSSPLEINVEKWYEKPTNISWSDYLRERAERGDIYFVIGVYQGDTDEPDSKITHYKIYLSLVEDTK